MVDIKNTETFVVKEVTSDDKQDITKLVHHCLSLQQVSFSIEAIFLNGNEKQIT